MSVTFEDALSTLEAMFPQWDRETLGARQLFPNSLRESSDKMASQAVRWS